MSVLLKVRADLWINPSQIVYVGHVPANNSEWNNHPERFNLWMGTDNDNPIYLAPDEWAAIEPLVTLPARAAGCTCGRENVTQKSLVLGETRSSASSVMQAVAEILEEEIVIVDEPDGAPETDLYRLIKVVQSGDFVILDTETTGLNGDAEICQISIIDANGNTLLDTLVKPQRAIPSDATRIHGITNDMVKDAPTWENVRPFVLGAMQEKDVVVYNAVYDRKMMHQSDEAGDLMYTDYKEASDWHCAMLAYAEYRGVWNDYHGNYKWHKLSDAADRVGYTLPSGMKAHSALADCLMTLAVCRKLAGL